MVSLERRGEGYIDGGSGTRMPSEVAKASAGDKSRQESGEGKMPFSEVHVREREGGTLLLLSKRAAERSLSRKTGHRHQYGTGKGVCGGGGERR